MSQPGFYDWRGESLNVMSSSKNNQFLVEEKLKESELRYHTLTQNVPLGIYRRTCGADGKLVMVNPALVEMFTYDSAEELNQVPVARLYWDPSECKSFSKKLFDHREIIKEQLKMKRRDGTPIWVAVTATVICDEEGLPKYFDGIMEDISAFKKVEEEEELRIQQLVQADKMISLGVLVSGIAHEINNPNQFIVSHIEALKKTWLDALPILDRYYKENGDFVIGGQKYSRRKERIAQMFENIETGTVRIKHIVDELRDYARERPVDHVQTVSLNKVVQSALALVENLVKKTAGQFYVDYAKVMPPFRGDYQRIEQVVINLLQNSCQALEQGVGKISITTRHDLPTDRVVVQINDTGCGISKQNLLRLTDPFFTTKRDVGGTGLGLSISETIVVRHGGQLEFESGEGRGTTARVSLPAYHSDADEED
jgi:PAS domain S-box-containing protein